tara:strand:- start:41878 stop:43059 length:1182 start_codon:yes stop_codon:yes gene_type:complete
MKCLIVLFSLLSLISCSGGSSGDLAAPADEVANGTAPYQCQSIPLTKGQRQFGMDILYEPKSGIYSQSLTTLKNMGAQFQTFHLNWNDLEGAGSGASSGVFSSTYTAYLDALNATASASGLKVTLRIHPVDVPGKSVPSDLVALRFNHANMITRYNQMLTYVFQHLSPQNVTRLVVGNEIDGYNPGGDTNFWLPDYVTFLEGIKDFLNSNGAYSGLKLGFVITYRGATDRSLLIPTFGNTPAPDIFTGWLQSTKIDFVGITYYPLNSDFTVKSNSQVAGVFDSLAAFTSKPIHIEEVGYPTSTALNGSDQRQAEFFCEVFKAWDKHSSAIPSLSILRMMDTTSSKANETAATYGLTGNMSFVEYIRSLGIRNVENQPKEAFSIIQGELKKRSF